MQRRSPHQPSATPQPSGLEQTPPDAEAVVWLPSGSSRSSMIASVAPQMTRRLSLGVSSVHNADHTDVTLTLEVSYAVREVQRVVQQVGIAHLGRVDPVQVIHTSGRQNLLEGAWHDLPLVGGIEEHAVDCRIGVRPLGLWTLLDPVDHFHKLSPRHRMGMINPQTVCYRRM
eukprot:scaffold170_cov411-Prasinococcus_capsulatus_cf.AAC.4